MRKMLLENLDCLRQTSRVVCGYKVATKSYNYVFQIFWVFCLQMEMFVSPDGDGCPQWGRLCTVSFLSEKVHSC